MSSEIETNVTALEDEIKQDLDTYNTTNDRDLAVETLASLEQDCIEYTKKYLPYGSVPIYVTPNTPDDINNRFGVATWNEYNSGGVYGGLDDSFCRPNQISEYQYPRRTITGDIELTTCDPVMNSTVKQMADISSEVPVLINTVKRRFIKQDLSNDNVVAKASNTLLNRIAEYDNTYREYLQLVRIIDNNMALVKRRQQDINKNMVKLDELDNQQNIANDIFNDNVKIENNKVTKNNVLIKYAKYLLWVFWFVAIGLILTININMRVTN